MKSKVMLLVVGLLLVLFSYSFAQVPQMINYQGKITTTAGLLVDSTIAMVFTVYTDSTGGTSLWTETQNSVKVEKGVFSVLLGSVNPISDSVFNGNVRYLGVKVGSDPEMTPRKVIVSVAYAYKSQYADTAEYAQSGAGGGVTDHGDLTGLADDDHPQYLIKPGLGTRNVNVQFGDSTMYVNNSGVVFGSNWYAPNDALVWLERHWNTTNRRKGMDVDVENLGNGEIHGVSVEVNSASSSSAYRYGVLASAGKSNNTGGYSFGVEGSAWGGSEAYGINGHAECATDFW